VGKSLVAVEPPDDGQVRYRLLENLRAYASERLAETEEGGALGARHRDWFLALAEEAEPHLTGPRQTHWLNRLERDHDNLRAALRWCQGEAAAPGPGAPGRGTPNALPRLAGALSRFWFVRSYLSEGLGWLEAALSAAPDAPAPVRAKALNGAGMLAWSCGDHAKARASHAQDLALRLALGDERGRARALANLGILASEQGEYVRAGALYAESLALYRAAGDTANIAHMLNNLGTLANMQGDYAGAEPLFQESLALFRRSENREGLANGLHNLGDLFLRQGRYGRAKPCFQESLRVQQALGDRQHIASILTHLAEVSGRDRDHERACLLFAAAQGLFRAFGVPQPVQDEQYRPTLEEARRALGEERFRRSWERGSALSRDQAVSLALEGHAAAE
jgi:non-specific serine/threonine protein kinase